MDQRRRFQIIYILSTLAGFILGILLIMKGQGIHTPDSGYWADSFITLFFTTAFLPIILTLAIQPFLSPPTDVVMTMVGGMCLGLILGSLLIAMGLVSGRGSFFTVAFCAFSLAAIGILISMLYNIPSVRRYLPLALIHLLPGLLLGIVVYGLGSLVDWNAPIGIGRTDPTILKTDGMRVTSAAKGGTGDLLMIVAVLAIGAIALAAYCTAQYALVRVASIPVNNSIERHFERKSKHESDSDELKLLKTEMRGIGHIIFILTCVSIVYLILMLMHQ